MSVTAEEAPRPVSTEQRSRNKMRPRTFKGVIGQGPAKTVLMAGVERSRKTGEPMPHTLLVGPSGYGKTTLAHVTAHELEAAVYEVEAPVSMQTLLQLGEVMRDGDILKIEEIHQQAIRERRSRSASTDPEVFYSIMEDRVIPTSDGILPYPAITVMGTTTDEGALPDAFVNRFPLRPRVVAYERDELVLMAARNAHVVDLKLRRSAAEMIVGASRGVPREINNLVKTVALFASGEIVEQHEVAHVLELNGTTPDGLTIDMRNMLTFLYTRCRRTTTDGSVRFQASVNTIATAIGKSRDSKAVALRVEPYLIEQGYVQVSHGGRQLTALGIKRAKELSSVD